MAFFIDPEGLPAPQLMFLTVVYGYVLFQSSGLISGGSELLLLVPSVAGLVGSIVLPILGAVPDGMMVLFSGLGPDAQEQVSVGVGALAGSTVMLLTFPWIIAVVCGRVPLDENGQAKYPASKEMVGFFNSGVGYGPEIPKGAKIMLATTLCFAVIQIPATFEEVATGKTGEQAKAENKFALAGLVICIVAFFGYLWLCFLDATDDKELAKIIDEVGKGNVSISIAVKQVRSSEKDSSLIDANYKRLRKISLPFFKRYDSDSTASISQSELYSLLKDLGTRMTWEDALVLFKKHDTGDANYGALNLDEFTKCLIDYLENEDYTHTRVAPVEAGTASNTAGGDEEEEAEEVPEDLLDLSPEQQMKRVIFRACWMMGLGTFLVLIFSDPMVDVLSAWGTVLGVSPFYISFIVAPFASNASELLAAYTYAVKKSQKSITTSFSTLLGASCMNNTFCLAIFFCLIYFKGLAWQFTAETIAIVLVQWLIGILVITRTTHTTSVGLAIFGCYPLCLFVVWGLENIVGLD
jgi:Ca2+/Na+ antiporter